MKQSLFVEFKVKPYTIKTDISNHIDEQKQELKTIFTNDDQYKVGVKNKVENQFSFISFF